MPDDVTDDQTSTETTETETETPKTYSEKDMQDVRREAAGYRTRLRAAETERDELKNRVTDLETRAQTAETLVAERDNQLTRLQVAVEKGIPKELVPRLMGNTPDELAADADSLLSMFKGQPTGNNDNGTRQSVEPPDLKTQIAEATAAGNIGEAMRLKTRLAFENSRPKDE